VYALADRLHALNKKAVERLFGLVLGEVCMYLNEESEVELRGDVPTDKQIF
jgi:nucleoid DNA-binding protein